MSQIECATCGAESLRAPRMVDGAWFALCTECLFETEMEATGEGAGAVRYRVKGAVGITDKQLEDLKRPQAATPL